MGTFANWEQDILNAIGAPVTQENVSFLDAWQNAESGSATFNPLNTTQPETGATNYNSAGVKDYTSAEQGTAATAQTLQNGYYPDLLTALLSGSPFSNVTDAVKQQLNTWGTGSAWIASAPGNPSGGATSGGIGKNPTGSGPLIGPGGLINTDPNNQFQFQVGAFDLGKWLQSNIALVIGIGMLLVAVALVMSDNNPIALTEKAASNG